MDLFAYITKQDEEISKYIDKYYGDIPRCRGVRFMKVEMPIENDGGEDSEVFNQYVGQDVIYIHTRCGDCGMGYDDPDSNYVYCGADVWEEEHEDLFLDHVTDDFDMTYCSHYFKAVIDNDYNKIIEKLKSQE